MEVKEALAQVRAKKAHLRERRERLADQLAEVDGELEVADADEAVLSRWAALGGGAIQANTTEPTDGPSDAEDWRGISRMKAVERALRGSNEPVSPPHVHQVLLEHKRDDPPDRVHAALGHLKIKGRATQAERGLWIAVTKANGQVPEESAKEIAEEMS